MSARCLRSYSTTIQANVGKFHISPWSCHIFNSACRVIRAQRRHLQMNSSVRSVHVMVRVPQMAESISEGTLSRLSKQVGDYVEEDEELASIETDKIDVSVNAPQAGKIAEILVVEGDVVTVGQDMARLETDSKISTDQRQSDVSTKAVGEKASSTSEVDPVNEIAKHSPEDSLQLEDRERTKQPMEKSKPPAKEGQPEEQTRAPALSSRVQGEQLEQGQKQQTSTSTSALGTFGDPGRLERVEKLPRIRKTIAQRLKQSQNMTASLTAMQEIDMTAVMQWRQRHRDDVLKLYGVRLGYMGAFVRAATLALQEVPSINSQMDLEREEIIFKDYVDISIAVSTPKGLVTPVVRDCHNLTIIEIEEQVAALAKKARDSKLTFEDLQGGNISISNPGIFGSMFGTPVINYPQSAVFNMNSISNRVVAVDGTVEIRPMMYITLTYDHRLIEDREAVQFLQSIKRYIEEPARMLLA